jgi:hypothetical protein
MVGPFGTDARYQKEDAPRNELRAGPRITLTVLRDVIDFGEGDAAGLMDSARDADGRPVHAAAPNGGDVAVQYTAAAGRFTVTWEA